MLEDVQVNTERLDPLPVLSRRLDGIREAAHMHPPAAHAASQARDVLDHAHTDLLGQIEDLAALAALKQLGVSQIPATALAGSFGIVPDLLIGNLDALKMRALVALLATGLAPRAPAQTAILLDRRLGYPSEDGGLEELREFLPSFARNSMTSASSSAIRTFAAARPATSSA